MEECPFCAIVAGERDAHVLAETDRTIAFLDSNPAATGHTLVAPKHHTEAIFSGDDLSSSEVFDTVQRVVTALEEALDPDGVSVFYTTGDLTGTVTHAHVHLLPRYVDDDIRVSLARRSLGDDASDLAAELRASVPEANE